MNVAYNVDELDEYLSVAADVSTEHSVVITKFLHHAKEIEMDAVANAGETIVYAISEHVEYGGVHSGDATLILPPHTLSQSTSDTIANIGRQIAHELKISGPFNVQFLVPSRGPIQVIECNLRASRSFPFVSKTLNTNFARLATMILTGHNDGITIKRSLPAPVVFACKAPMFSFARLPGADPRLGVEMASTGEVACFGHSVHEAFLKAKIASGFRLPRHTALLSVTNLDDNDVPDFIRAAGNFHRYGLQLMATKTTTEFLHRHGIKCVDTPHAIEFVKGRAVDLVVEIGCTRTTKEMSDGYLLRRAAIECNLPLMTNISTTLLLSIALLTGIPTSFEDIDSYLGNEG